jgi:hypothetical protein
VTTVLLHGEFCAKNLDVRAGKPDHKLGVVHRESAAIGANYLDLVSLSVRWSAQEKRALWRACFDRYQADTGLRLVLGGLLSRPGSSGPVSRPEMAGVVAGAQLLQPLRPLDGGAGYGPGRSFPGRLGTGE